MAVSGKTHCEGLSLVELFWRFPDDASAQAWREGDETLGYPGQDLRIPNTVPEQLAQVLLRGGAHPRPKAKKPATGQ